MSYLVRLESYVTAISGGKEVEVRGISSDRKVIAKIQRINRELLSDLGDKAIEDAVERLMREVIRDFADGKGVVDVG